MNTGTPQAVSLARPDAKPTTAPGYPPQQTAFPQAGGQAAPSQPPYGAPQQPGQFGVQQPGQYGAPQPAGQFGAPQAQPGPYGAPQPGQQPYGAQQPGRYGAQQPYGAPQAQPYGSQQPYGAPQPGQQPGQLGQQPQYGAQPVMGMAPNAMPSMGATPAQPGQPGVISLVKNQNMSLTKVAPNLRHARIGLGWDVRQTPGAPFDLDTSIFLLNAAGKIRMPQDFIFYNNKQSADGSVVHYGDNLTGAGEGDDEQMAVDLTRVPPDVQRILVVCSIYEAEQRQQNFGMVQRAFIRVVDQDSNIEIVRYDLTEEACMWNTMCFGEIYRYNNEWKFKALGAGSMGGLRGLGSEFGIALA